MNNRQANGIARRSQAVRNRPVPNKPKQSHFANNAVQASSYLKGTPMAGSTGLRQAALMQLQGQQGNGYVQRYLSDQSMGIQRQEETTTPAAAPEESTSEETGWLDFIYEQGSEALTGVVDTIDAAADTLGDLIEEFGFSVTSVVTEEDVAAETPPETEPLEAGAAALATAIAGGERNPNVLTDIVFYARNPDRQDKPINPTTEKDLITAWKNILENEVKPALQAPIQEQPAKADPQETGGSPVAEPIPEATPGSVEALLAALAEQDEIAAINAVITSLTEIQNSIDGPNSDEAGNEKKLANTKLWKAIEDTTGYTRYKEGTDAQHDEMTALLATARDQVNGLTTASLQAVAPEVTDAQTAQIIGYFHRQLNSLTPFFTQMANMNVLHKGSSDAWKRTCNVTSLAMVLLSLGVGADAFNGDQTTLVKIASHLEPSITSWDQLMSLRMPDFVQFVAVYTAYKDGPESEMGTRIDSARDTVAPKVSTTLNIFTDIVQYFGVTRVHSAEIDSHGKAIRTNKDRGADNQLDPNAFKTSQFKADVNAKVSPWLDQGGQIIVNRPGHYLRLQNFDDSGVTFDDPGDEGKNFKVTWEESNKIGHFRSWQVFQKG